MFVLRLLQAAVGEESWIHQFFVKTAMEPAVCWNTLSSVRAHTHTHTHNCLLYLTKTADVCQLTPPVCECVCVCFQCHLQHLCPLTCSGLAPPAGQIVSVQPRVCSDVSDLHHHLLHHRFLQLLMMFMLRIKKRGILGDEVKMSDGGFCFLKAPG